MWDARCCINARLQQPIEGELRSCLVPTESSPHTDATRSTSRLFAVISVGFAAMLLRSLLQHIWATGTWSATSPHLMPKTCSCWLS